MYSPLISIIIPVYNNEKYIANAIKSIESQSFEEWEMIIVDDGSTDNTPKIVDNIAATDGRIVVLHQDNQWIYASMNNGIKNAKGRYIYILNSDDQMVEGGLELLAKKIIDCNYPDVIWTDVIVTVLDEKEQIKKQTLISSKGVEERVCNSRSEVISSWEYIYRNRLMLNQANLYKKSLFKDELFRNDVYGADKLFNTKLYNRIESCVVLQEPVYVFYDYRFLKGNASLKYYGYENRMYDEFFIEDLKLIKALGIDNNRNLKIIAKERLNNFNSIEIYRLLSLDISVEEKLKKLFTDYMSKTLMEAANASDKEFLERIVLRNAKKIIYDTNIKENSDYYFVKKLIEILSESYIDEELFALFKNCVSNKNNRFGIGESYINRMQKRLQYNNIIPKKNAKKVLWLSNVVLTEVADILLIRQTEYGGWISGLFNELRKDTEYRFAVCVPIQKRENCKDGTVDNYRYYSFLEGGKELIQQMVSRFEEIIDNYQPNIIHIWGTEYTHTYAMILACENKGLLDKTVIHIQGLVSLCGEPMLDGITSEMRQDNKLMKSITDYQMNFGESATYEKRALKKARHIIGRTQWDKKWGEKLAPNAQYHECKEIMRNEVYTAHGLWKADKCTAHTIFMSQASYPLKGLHLVLKVFVDLKGRFPDLLVRIAGVNPVDANKEYGEYISEQIKCLQLEENIEFIGNCDVNRMIEEYKKANVFLLASTLENSSNSLQEAMIIGTPIVASNVGGTPSLIEHGKTGFLYDLDKPEGALSQIAKIFDDMTIAKYVSSNEIIKAGLTSKKEIKNSIVKIYYEM
ncbi:glycosyltransferase [Pseudobutyrivibrio sp. MD2005]|uniref:glycosyltransferase n=1 Tax=Pseudobutyrivibrio sp. MD2005 TaxID=1410616 RepID=UPI000485053F|nr:glycosyltransferase [Pseudobutyrivibrio sp. MD2005]